MATTTFPIPPSAPSVGTPMSAASPLPQRAAPMGSPSSAPTSVSVSNDQERANALEKALKAIFDFIRNIIRSVKRAFSSSTSKKSEGMTNNGSVELASYLKEENDHLKQRLTSEALSPQSLSFQEPNQNAPVQNAVGVNKASQPTVGVMQAMPAHITEGAPANSESFNEPSAKVEPTSTPTPNNLINFNEIVTNMLGAKAVESPEAQAEIAKLQEALNEELEEIEGASAPKEPQGDISEAIKAALEENKPFDLTQRLHEDPVERMSHMLDSLNSPTIKELTEKYMSSGDEQDLVLLNQEIEDATVASFEDQAKRAKDALMIAVTQIVEDSDSPLNEDIIFRSLVVEDLVEGLPHIDRNGAVDNDLLTKIGTEIGNNHGEALASLTLSKTAIKDQVSQNQRLALNQKQKNVIPPPPTNFVKSQQQIQQSAFTINPSPSDPGDDEEENNMPRPKG